MSIPFSVTMPASGGVEAIPATGTEINFGAQLIANSLLRSGDVSILGLRIYDGDVARTSSLSLSSRFPLWGGLRAGPRLRFDYRQFSADGTTQWLASPAVRIDWHSNRTTIEFEAGGEWMSRELAIAVGTSKSQLARARMLLRALKMDDAVGTAVQASQVFATLSWRNTLAYPADHGVVTDDDTVAAAV